MSGQEERVKSSSGMCCVFLQNKQDIKKTDIRQFIYIWVWQVSVHETAGEKRCKIGIG